MTSLISTGNDHIKFNVSAINDLARLLVIFENSVKITS